MTKQRQSKPDNILPAATGAALERFGVCPSCHNGSHPGVTCSGRTTDEVLAVLWPGRRFGPPRRTRS